MTEKEAKNKICPIMYSAKLGAGGCLASNCACWAWETIMLANGQKHEVMTKDGRQGRCGLMR